MSFEGYFSRRRTDGTWGGLSVAVEHLVVGGEHTGSRADRPRDGTMRPANLRTERAFGSNFDRHDAGGGVVDHGTFLVVRKHDGGEWKLHRDIWNSNTPDEG